MGKLLNWLLTNANEGFILWTVVFMALDVEWVWTWLTMVITDDGLTSPLSEIDVYKLIQEFKFSWNDIKIPFQQSTALK